MTKKVLLSGIQPSGNLMIGNYIGALKNWVTLQHDYDCLFILVDLHTITVKQDPKILRQRCYDFLALYIACGIDPEQNTIFAQSHVPQHAELAWILNCQTYFGELNRMTQFKDKSKKHADNINIGLFDYPVLMAADILLYGTDLVPVGEDQKQHLELTRDLAQRFNATYGETFKLPKPFIPKIGARIMSLQDPTKKMSKSDDNIHNYIALLDSPDLILKKLQRAVTDSGSEIKFTEDKAGISNLLSLLAVIGDEKIADLEIKYQGIGYGKFKTDVAEAVIEILKPIQTRYRELTHDLSYLNQILKKGAENASARADNMLSRVRDLIGFIQKS